MSRLAPPPLSPSRVAAGDSLLELRGVRKVFANGTIALDGLDLTVGRHEFLSLLGPSGCGKSTALRLIAGLVEPSAGRVVRPDGAAGDIGFVFQEPTLMPWATVFDNVRLPLRLRGQGRRQASGEVEEALALVGLADFARAFPRELSGGMRMRVSIARALVTRPRLLLMDEPFAALDEITRIRLNHDLLELWQKQGWTVVFVTHSVYEAVFLASRIVVMSARPGRSVAELEIAEPYPRDEDYRLSEPYLHHCREVSLALQRAMGDA